MQPEEIKAMVEAELAGASASVKSDGSHYELTVICDAFAGQGRLQREQQINRILAEAITSGAVHALSNRLYTQAEWETASKLQVS